jgi:hypothetical protein
LAHAETRGDEAARLSALTISAMECSFLSNDDHESQRLRDIGIAAGKELLDLMPKLSAEERTGRIALIWYEIIPGYSTDFILGRLWERLNREVHQQLGNDTKTWDSKKAERYHEKNCMVIR